jgi:cell division protease FtsH
MEPESSKTSASQSTTASVEARRPTRPSAPWWLWLLTIGGFGLIFWQFMPAGAHSVPYSPWFLDQVESGNIQSLTIQGMEIRGVVRDDNPGRDGADLSRPRIRRFVTYFPSEQSIEPVVRRLREARKDVEPATVETGPSQEGGLLRLVLLVQAFSLLAIVFLLASLRARRA